MAFIEAPQTLDEVAMIPRLVNGPCLINIVPGGRTPEISLHGARELGFRLAILPGMLIAPAIGTFDAALTALRDQEATGSKSGLNVREMFRRLGAPEWDALRRQLAQAGG